MGLPQPLSLTRFRRNQYLPRVYGPAMVPLVFSNSFGEFGVSESLNQQIDRLEEIYHSELDPQGRAFVPLADAHRRLGDLGKALAVIQEGLGTHPDFASAHIVAGWVHRSREEPDDAMRSFERVLALDADNMLARAAIAELIDDQRAQTYRAKVAARGSAEPTAEAERPVVPIASLAPGAPTETIAAPDAAPELVPVDDGRPVVPIASLAAKAPTEATAAPDAAPELVPIDDGRPVVPIASLAPQAPAETSAAIDTAPEVVPDVDARPVVPIAELAPGAPDDDGRPVVPIPSLAPDVGNDAPDDLMPAGGEIYTETLAELYAGQGAPYKAIEVYKKLIANDPNNAALTRRLTELETLEPGSERQTVPIESLAPDAG